MGVLWITGLSGSGKTTLAHNIISKTPEFKWVHIDGDQLRPILNTVQLYDRKSRVDLARKYSQLAFLFLSQGHNVIVSTISLFSEIHNWNRKNFEQYFEVFIEADITKLNERDSKSIYSDKVIANIMGIDLNFDKPVNTNYEFKQDFDLKSLNFHTNNIISKLNWLKIK